MNTHEVIIYRSPLEKQVYDFWLDPGNFEWFFYLFGGLLFIVFAVYLYYNWFNPIVSKVKHKLHKR